MQSVYLNDFFYKQQKSILYYTKTHFPYNMSLIISLYYMKKLKYSRGEVCLFIIVVMHKKIIRISEWKNPDDLFNCVNHRNLWLLEVLQSFLLYLLPLILGESNFSTHLYLICTKHSIVMLQAIFH